MIKIYGADAIRWFMLSDSPPEKDINWSESGINGAWKICQKIWAIVTKNRDILLQEFSVKTNMLRLGQVQSGQDTSGLLVMTIH